MKKITVTEIAKLSGVSKATVSRVLNSTATVSEDVKRKVEKVIEQTGYKRSKTKLQLSLKFNKITVISDEEDLTTPNSFFSAILAGLTKETEKLNLKIEWILKHQMINEDILTKKLENSEAIIMISIPEPKLFKKIKSYHRPMVIMNGVDPEMKVSSISPDYELGAFLATSVLAQNNHKNIKFITADIKHSIYQRTEGYRRAMLMLGLPYESQNNIIDLVNHANSVDPSGKLKKQIKDRKAGMDFGATRILPHIARQGIFDNTTAIFCMCDMIAIALIDTLTEIGLRVPQDISVIGFDNLNISAMTSPPLTTICTDYKRLAISAIHMLIQASSNTESIAMRSNVGVEIVERESVKALT